MMNHNFLTFFIAYILDLIIGDPQWNWHPIRLIGNLINILDKKLNTGKKISGIILVILTITIVTLCTWILLKLSKFNFYLNIISIILIYFALSTKALAIEAKKVFKALQEKNIEKARKNLSMIVGRNTNNLEEQEIIRATIETVAENTLDAIIAPMFYIFVGGPILGWIYKTINTLDSMIGYKNEKYREFGWFAAKIDDIANFIPAILASILIPIASFFTGKKFINSFKIMFRDGKFISGIPESAVAGALQIQLGGINFYDEVGIVSKPLLGDKINILQKKHILDTINIAYVSSFLTIFLGIIL